MPNESGLSTILLRVDPLHCVFFLAAANDPPCGAALTKQRPEIQSFSPLHFPFFPFLLTRLLTLWPFKCGGEGDVAVG